MASLLFRFRFFLIKEYRNLYPVKSSIFTHAFAELVTIILYWYTAKALAPKIEFSGKMGDDYFSYIMLGELALLIPATLFSHYTKAVKEMVKDGVLDYLHPQPFNKPLFLIESVSPVIFLRGIQWLLTLLIIYNIFNFNFPVERLLAFLLIILIALPSFVGLGLIAAAIVVRFGRGERVVMMLSNTAYILAGVYFPTDVFPLFFQKTLDFISPFNILLKSVRRLRLENIDTSTLFYDLVSLILSGSCFLVIGYLFIGYAFKKAILRKTPILL